MDFNLLPSCLLRSFIWIHLYSHTYLNLWVLKCIWVELSLVLTLIHSSIYGLNFFWTYIWIALNTSAFSPIWIKLNKSASFFRITQYNVDAHASTLTLMNTRTQTLTPMNTRMQTLPLWAPPKDWTGKSRDSRSYHQRLAVDGDVAYHWKHSAVKS
jgi:hypothetical protein